MADDDKLSDVDLTYGRPAPEQELSWGDYLKGAKSGAWNQLVGAPAAIAEDLAGANSRFGAAAGDLRRTATENAQEALSQTSPAFQRRVSANIFYGDGPSIWSEGVGGSLLAKAAVSSPSIIATVVGTALTGGSIAGLMATGGAITAGSVVSDIYQKLESLPDEELRKNSPVYAGYRSMGMSEQEARGRIMDDAVSVEPYLLAGVTSLLGGAEAALGGRLAGQAATRGAMRNIGVVTAKEGGQEFLEEGGQESLQQYATKPFTLSEMDWMKALESGLQGAAVGAPFGAVAGGVEAIGGRPDAPARTTPGTPAGTQEVTPPASGLDTGDVDPAQRAALEQKLAPKAEAVKAKARGKKAAAADPAAQPPPPTPPDAATTTADKLSKRKKVDQPVNPMTGKPALDPAKGPFVQPTAPAPAAIDTGAVETPEQEAARLAAELSPGVDPAAVEALQAKTAPVPAPPEQEAAQMVKDLTQPAPAPVAVDPVPPVPSVSSAQEGPVVAATPSAAASPEERTPPQGQVSPAPTVDPPAATTPYDRAIALIESGTPLTSVNSVQLKVNTGYKTAVKLYNRLKQEGRISDPVPRPVKAPQAAPVAAPVPTQPVAVEAAPAPAMGQETAIQEAPTAPKGEALKKSNRTKPSDLTQQVTPPAAEVRKVEITPEQEAAYVAASEAGKRRVLQPATPEAIAAAEATSNAMLDRIAANKAKAEEDAVKAKKLQKKIQDAAQGKKVGGDKNKKRVVKKAEKADAVMNIIQQGTPSKGTVVKNRDDMLGVQIRLEGLLEEARKQGHKPQARNYDSTPTSIVYLSHAEMMLEKLRKTLGSDKASAEEIDNLIDETNDFLAEEFDARNGGGELMRRKRREIGDLTSDPKKVLGDTEVKANPDDNPAQPDSYERPTLDEDTSDGPDVAEVVEEDDSNEDVTRQEVPVRERPVPKAQEDDVRGYAGVKEGTVKKEVVVGGRKKLNLAPPVEAKKVTLAPRGAALLRKVQAATTQQVTDEVAALVDPSKPMPAFTDIDGIDQNTNAVESDVAEVLGEARKNFNAGNGMLGSALNAMHAVVSKRIANLVGDVPVTIVSMEDMRTAAANVGVLGPNGEVPAGLYYPTQNRILLAYKTLTDPNAAYVVLHEAVHAATTRVLDGDAELRSEFRTIMQLVRNSNEGGALGAAEAYGMRNEYEFVAELFSNPRFQQMLGSIPIPPDVARQYGLREGRAIRSLWDWAVAAVRRALGLPSGSYTVLDAAMRLGDYTLNEASPANVGPVISTRALPGFLGNMITQRVGRTAASADAEPITGDAGPRLMGLRTFDSIARAADQYFGGGDANPVRKVQETVEKMRVFGQDVYEKSHPVIENLYQMEKKYAGEKWDNFANLTHDATMLNVHPDKPLGDPANTHLSKRADAQAIAAWKDLNARWNALPDELKQAWLQTTKYYRDMQNAMSFGILKNRVLKTLANKLSEAELDGLARRYFNDLDTEADQKLLGKDLHNALKAIDELKSIKGPYFPQMRRGDWAVIGRVAFDAPTNAKQMDETTFQFKDENAALAYAEKLWRNNGIKAEVKQQYVDPATGLPYFTDTDGTLVKATSKEPDAEKRYLVGIQNEFLEYHATQAEAEQRASELGRELKKVAVEERRVQPNARGELYSEQLRSVMKRIEQKDAYKTLSPEARRETVTALNELSFQLFGATRIQSRRIPRRYVAGASKDITRNALEYAQSVSGYIGKLRYQPEQDAAVKQMRDYIEKYRYEDRERGVARSRIANEVDRRLSQPPQAVLSGLDQNIQRALTLSFLDKLASLSYSVINSTQTVTNTVPLLAARHGWAKTTTAMAQAYSMIGGGRNVGTGLANVGRAFKATQQVNLMDPVRTRLAKHGAEYVQLFDYLRERGVVSSDAGMEVIKAARMGKGIGGAIDKGLSYGDAIARALPDAVEVNNRVASAVATYMLAREAGMTVEKARQRAYDVVNTTQFNYSQTNAPAFMNHPMARIAFQFKKYAQGVYQMLGEQVGKVLANAQPGDRKEGIKALVNFAIVTSVFAGVLGLPTEPIKYMLMAASIFGLGYSYDDLERDVRAGLANMLGQGPAEMVTRGVTRGLPMGLAFDLSSRMGMSDLTSFGLPKENTMDAWSAWLWKTTAGAPVSLGTDMIRGAHNIATGEYQKGVELLIPFKQVADAVSSYRLMTEGKESAVTGRQTMRPLTGTEAAIRTLGFRPGVEVETMERDNAYYTVKKERMGNRQRLVSQWLNADNGDERAEVWKQIVKYNAKVDEAARITMGQLTTAQKRRRSEERRGTIVDGKRVTKDDRAIYDTGNIYNVR